MREVDVLITGNMAGHPIRIGVECRGRSRKDPVSWVEEMRAKHDDLPTDRLVLVSASGFSAAAAAKARHYGIETVIPGQPIADDGPLARLKAQRMEFRDVTHNHLVAIHGALVVDGQPHIMELTVDHVLFAADGIELGRVGDLARSILERLDLRSAVAAAQDGDRYLVTTATRPWPHLSEAGPVEAYLRRESDPPHLLPLLGLRIIYASRVDVRHVELTVGELQGTPYAYGSGRVGGADALVVVTDAADGEQLAVRLTDASGAVTDWTADPMRQELIPHMPTTDQ